MTLKRSTWAHCPEKNTYANDRETLSVSIVLVPKRRNKTFQTAIFKSSNYICRYLKRSNNKLRKILLFTLGEREKEGYRKNWKERGGKVSGRCEPRPRNVPWSVVDVGGSSRNWDMKSRFVERASVACSEMHYSARELHDTRAVSLFIGPSLKHAERYLVLFAR